MKNNLFSLDVLYKNKFSKIVSFYHKHKKFCEIFAIITIFLIGTFIRLYNYPTNSGWVGDTGRDMLAGYLIAFKGMTSKHGPSNTGIDFVYPPLYYYFMAFLNLITNGNHNILVGLIILYHSFGIILSYIIVKNEFSTLPALIISLFYALSRKFVFYSMFLVSASNSVILVLLSLLFFQSALKNNKIINLVLSAILLSLAISFWYGSLLILPIYLVVLIFELIEKKNDKYSFLKIFIFGISLALSFIIIFLPIIDSFNFKDIYKQLLGNGLNKLDWSIFKIDNFLETIDIVFKDLHPKLTSIMYLIYVLIAAFGLFFSKNYHSKKYVFICILALSFHLIFYNIHRSPLWHYLTYTQFILAGLLAYGLKTSFDQNKLIFLFLTFMILFSSESFKLRRFSGRHSYQHIQQVSNLINHKFPGFSIIDGGERCNNTINDMYWESRAYWYFQKEKPYFVFDDNNSQIELINTNTVLLCWEDIYQSEINNDYLSSNEVLLKFRLENIEYKIFAN